ncbi:hypothetical protein C4565_07545 [Candidatus Parcubacteria bacterium]|jgi:hypothetical protein|nr:MAG: hypothetical protein C4565_07545 [Candidatus Parcubacteria bacterium]
MNEQTKKISIFGAVAIILLIVLVYTLPENANEQKKTAETQKMPETIVRDFYNWYKEQTIGVLDDGETIVNLAKEKGFVTQEFAISAMFHPLVVSKKADVIICASKKDNTAFPNIFIPFPTASSTEIVRVEAASPIQNHKINILFNTKEKKIISITCPVIPNLE